MTNVTQKNKVPIRHMKFDFDPDKASLYCHKNNDFSSAFILTFSVLIPRGERVVIEAVRAYRDKIVDPELKMRVNGLIGQEAMHSKIHEEFNAMYEAKGLPVKAIDRMGYWYFDKFLLGVLPKSWQSRPIATRLGSLIAFSPPGNGKARKCALRTNDSFATCSTRVRS